MVLNFHIFITAIFALNGLSEDSLLAPADTLSRRVQCPERAPTVGSDCDAEGFLLSPGLSRSCIYGFQTEESDQIIPREFACNPEFQEWVEVDFDEVFLDDSWNTGEDSTDGEGRRRTESEPELNELAPDAAILRRRVDWCHTDRNCGVGQQCSKRSGFCYDSQGGGWGQACSHPSHCKSGFECPGNENGHGFCQEAQPKAAWGMYCSKDFDCKSRYCQKNQWGQGTCQTANAFGRRLAEEIEGAEEVGEGERRRQGWPQQPQRWGQQQQPQRWGQPKKSISKFCYADNECMSGYCKPNHHGPGQCRPDGATGWSRRG